MEITHKVVAAIDRDYLYEGEKDTVPSRVGTKWFNKEVDELETLPEEKTRFRMLDDDRIPYYGGWLLNDDHCLVQLTLLHWGEHDAGCTIIEVKNKDNEWEQEIA